MMIIIAEFFVVILKVLWAFVTAGAKWVVRPKEKSVAGQVCVITGAGSGLGRLFAKEFARRRAILVLWDINSQSNEETAELVRQMYHELDTPVAKDGKPDLFYYCIIFLCSSLDVTGFHAWSSNVSYLRVALCSVSAAENYISRTPAAV